MNKLQWILFGSMIAVIVIAAISIILIKLKIKKLQAKYLNQDREQTYLMLQNLRNDIGQLPFDLKDYLKNDYKPYDIEAVINTIYTNNFQSTLIIDNQDSFLSSVVSNKTKRKIYYLNEYDFSEQLKETISKYPQDLENTNLISYSQNMLDFVVIFKNNKTLMELFDTYFDFMISKSMMMILTDNYSKKELVKFVKHIKTLGLTYEISYVESKFLYIVKQ